LQTRDRLIYFSGYPSDKNGDSSGRKWEVKPTKSGNGDATKPAYHSIPPKNGTPNCHPFFFAWFLAVFAVGMGDCSWVGYPLTLF